METEGVPGHGVPPGRTRGKHYASWNGALRQRPECRLDAPDIATDGGMWTARMHNSTVCRVLDGLVSARATGNREPEGMNEILRDIPPRRGVLPVPDPERWEGRLNHSFRLSRESAAKQNRVGDGGSPGPGRWEGRLNHSSLLNREPAENKSRRDGAAVPAVSSRTSFARCSNFLLSQKRSG